MTERAPEPFLKLFAYQHMSSPVQFICEPFSTMAKWVVETLPDNEERTIALRQLLEARNFAVRAIRLDVCGAPREIE